MLNYFERRKLDAELELLKYAVVDDILHDINHQRNSIEDMEDTLSGSHVVLDAIRTLQRYIESCDRTERQYSITD